MSSLEERKLYNPDFCGHCNHCKHYEGYDPIEQEGYHVLFCCLGYDPETVNEIIDNLWDKEHNNRPAYSDRSKEFLQLTSDEQAIWFSPRCVAWNKCCQFYEKES